MANRGNTVRCSIVDQNDNFIGLISLTGIDYLNQSAELHIMICDGKNQGKGAGTFAVNAMLDHAFNNMNLHRIELSVLENNERAQHLYEKAGFVREGILRKAYYKNGEFVNAFIYAILRDEFLKKYRGGVNFSDLSLPTFCIEKVDTLEMKEKIIELCDTAFLEKIRSRADYSTLVSKINAAAEFFVAYNENVLGYAAMYANDISTKTAYITLIGVRTEYQNNHVGKSLLMECLNIAKIRGMKKLRLEVLSDNLNAIRFYKKNGFVKEDSATSNSVYMVRNV